ncbi:jg13136 [Pararge aegeria aegeria]|uniref:Jg13136 protein n=1 Tax=Pararge aegeria aegeria TaxID=348720 RepID=A0A8S4RVY7_9NEOP|nr:jg13136 [Pararge aegeria aegeria]
MGILKNWFKTSSPMVKVLMAISVTSGVVVINKLYYAPYARRQRHLKSEEWANMILDQEEAMKESMGTQ